MRCVLTEYKFVTETKDFFRNSVLIEIFVGSDVDANFDSFWAQQNFICLYCAIFWTL